MQSLMRIMAVFCLLACLPAQVLLAEVYRWTDEQGRVHFSDQPPDEKGEAFDVKSFQLKVPEVKENPELQRHRQLLRKSFAADDLQKAENSKRQQELSAKKAERKAYCQSVKNRLKRSVRAGYVYDVDKKGNKIVLSDEQRNDYERDLQSAIKKYCS
jgi:hypothetical protein